MTEDESWEEDMLRGDDGFHYAFTYILRWEGGYVDHPEDPGGETNLGITQQTLKGARNVIPGLPDHVADLTEAHTYQIYYRLYWLEAHCHEILHEGVAFCMFDCAVNQGTGRAIKFLQQSIGVKVDGIFGPVTKSHANMSGNPIKLIRDFQARRAVHYASLSHFPTFGKGWMKRLMETTIRATLLLGD